ncbi:class I SAM-dependent methyltransferase [Photorhabdus akhurstii]|uniref:class I SAM-dependent methyltransferase n=1 Tax=Photorhabdus akhurstii TaxID=171438 RepID=UPI000D4624B0|nr:class I SAM-dependent methyltransferase [Photorhabdus luminescens]
MKIIKSLCTFEWHVLPILAKGLIGRGFLALLRRQREDRWLERWLPLIQDRVMGLAVLELGCGNGRDTAIIHRAGLKVKAIDISSAMIKRARVRTPSAVFFVQDLRDPFPIDRSGVVISSLSLHYFSWDETLDIIRRIRAVLRPGGVLLCRLNSTKDVNFGAKGHAKIDNNFYLVHGTPKRFFDRPSILKAFSGWKVLHIEEKETYRFVLPKTIWEVILEVEVN